MKNKWFCIGKSGATVDGRHIEAETLKQMAESYNPAQYGARLNIEHFRPFFPGSDMGGYGDVLELKTEVDGQETRLLARIDPTEKLQALLQKREKVFTSMEIIKNFAGSGKAYLVGLALTDSPASTGTSMLQFSMQQHPEALFSQHTEMKEYKMTDTQKAEAAKKPGMFATLMASLFAADKPKEQPAEQEFAPSEENETRLAAAEAELQAAYTEIEKSGEAYSGQQVQLTELAQKLAALEAAPVNTKAPHTGFSGTAKSDF